MLFLDEELRVLIYYFKSAEIEILKKYCNYPNTILERKKCKMLNIGVGELAVLLLIALIVVGPADLPKVAVAIAKGIKYIRRMSRELMSALQAEAELSELKEVKEVIDEITDPNVIVKPIKQELEDVTSIAKQEISDVNKVVETVAKEDLNQKIDILNKE